MSITSAALSRIKRGYLQAALKGDSDEALRVVEDGVRGGWGALNLYQEVVTEAGAEVGAMWLRGAIDVAQEHLVTQVNLRVMEQLRRKVQPTVSRGLRVVVACVLGNFHGVGPRMVSDYYFLDGWEVDFLGENVPTQDLVRFVARRAADLVALSVALEDQTDSAIQVIGDLRLLTSPPRIIVGGPLVRHRPGLFNQVGADREAADALEAVREAHRLFEFSDKPLDLEAFLQGLGSRVQIHRKALGWNQERLARASGLDRTYISAVENGKQNITLGALVKLADGLCVPVTSLLGGQGTGESTGQEAY